MLRSAALGIVSAAVVAVAPLAAKDQALVIAINKYPDITENGKANARDLEKPVFDGQNMQRLFVEKFDVEPDNITLLTDEAATKAGILEAMEQKLLAGTSPGDRVYFYFSGHGAQTAADGTGADVKANLHQALAPYDARGELTGGGGLTNLLLDTELTAFFDKVKDRVVTIIVDACHSGSIVRAVDVAARSKSLGSMGRVKTLTPGGPLRWPAAAVNPRTKSLEPAVLAQHKTRAKLLDVVESQTPVPNIPGRRVVWTATTTEQLAYEHPQREGSVFTLAFADGVRRGDADKDGDGKISGQELLQHVRKITEAYCLTDADCPRHGFTPELTPGQVALAEIVVPPGALSVLTPQGSYTGAPQQQTVTGPTPGPGAAQTAAVAVEPVQVAQAVLSHDNDFDLDLRIAPGTQLKGGETMRFLVKSAARGKLILLDQGIDGKLQQIYPNQFSNKSGKSDDIPAGREIRIPDETYGFQFRAKKDKKGHAALIAVVSESAINIDDLVGGTLKFDVIGNPAEFLTRLAARLSAPYVTPDPYTANRAPKWAVKIVKYSVY